MTSQCRRVLVLFVVLALTFIGCMTASHPGRANHLAKAKERAADPYEITLIIRFLANYYGTEEDRLIQWVASGLTVEDVALVLGFRPSIAIENLVGRAVEDEHAGSARPPRTV